MLGSCGRKRRLQRLCVCVGQRGGHLTTLSTGDGCISEDHHGAHVEDGHVEDGVDGAAWRQGDQKAGEG